MIGRTKCPDTPDRVSGRHTPREAADSLRLYRVSGVRPEKEEARNPCPDRPLGRFDPPDTQPAAGQSVRPPAELSGRGASVRRYVLEVEGIGEGDVLPGLRRWLKAGRRAYQLRVVRIQATGRDVEAPAPLPGSPRAVPEANAGLRTPPVHDDAVNHCSNTTCDKEADRPLLGTPGGCQSGTSTPGDRAGKPTRARALAHSETQTGDASDGA